MLKMLRIGGVLLAACEEAPPALDSSLASAAAAVVAWASPPAVLVASIALVLTLVNEAPVSDYAVSVINNYFFN